MANLSVFGTTWKERASAMGVLEGILSYSFEIDLESCRIYISVAAKNNKLRQIASLIISLQF